MNASQEERDAAALASWAVLGSGQAGGGARIASRSMRGQQRAAVVVDSEDAAVVVAGSSAVRGLEGREPISFASDGGFRTQRAGNNSEGFVGMQLGTIAAAESASESEPVGGLGVQAEREGGGGVIEVADVGGPPGVIGVQSRNGLVASALNGSSDGTTDDQ